MTANSTVIAEPPAAVGPDRKPATEAGTIDGTANCLDGFLDWLEAETGSAVMVEE
ncbi:MULTISPECIES: hypothetical protein [unclassified Natrinema]|uniref:hypothetical protein n=1 Tax=unclassified Natrinema TaxID=2622230 RepID=UPI00026D4B81|nr:MULTISPECIES: hypothetical protein [unclassified Natrinema]AFO57165.1 hypothetical protein NJ7G_1924 [Natrinema sp. J7-2]